MTGGYPFLQTSLKRRMADEIAGKTNNDGCRLSRANDCDLLFVRLTYLFMNDSNGMELHLGGFRGFGALTKRLLGVTRTGRIPRG